MKKKDVLIKQEDNIGNAVGAIKTALLQGQLEASGNVNRVQLIVYFAIGRYISLHTRHGGWGKGVLESISERLHRELPGLRGFSANSLKNMRKFYENWRILDSDEAAASGADCSTIAIVGNRKRKSTIAIVDLVPAETIDIHHNFTRSISSADKARKAISMFKDSYLLDFINVCHNGSKGVRVDQQ